MGEDWFLTFGEPSDLFVVYYKFSVSNTLDNLQDLNQDGVLPNPLHPHRRWANIIIGYFMILFNSEILLKDFKRWGSISGSRRHRNKTTPCSCGCPPTPRVLSRLLHLRLTQRLG